jgi:RNA recognition motif-containing protein
MNIYVGNLDYKVSENELEELFAKYGSVSSAKIITDKFDGRSKGFGFVEMENNDEAQKAIKALNGYSMESRELNVNEARERKSRQHTY